MKERSLRACKPCRLRKVKCDGDGEQECTKCRKLGLTCLYPESNPNLRLRRSTVRGSVIQSCLDTTSSNGDTATIPSSHTTTTPSQELSDVDEHFFLNLASDYSNYVLPTMSVVSEADLVAAMGNMHKSQDAYAFVHSVAAATLIVMHDDPTVLVTYVDRIRSLCTKAIHARGPLMSSLHVTVESTLTSCFLAKCFADAEHDDKLYYYYLRDAITRLQLLRVDDAHNQARQTQSERVRRERLYWLLFIHERFDALSNFRPVVLPPLPSLPEYDPALPISIHLGFTRLVEIFRMVDAKFIRYRIDISNSSITVDWIRQKQAELGSNIESWEEDISGLSHAQQVDLCVTRHWLRAIVWQMSLQMFSIFPDSRAEEDFMSVLFPVQLSHKLRSLLSNTPRSAVEIHSTGIVHKIFEIVAISADILEHVIARIPDPTPYANHIDDFVFLSRFCSSMPRFNERTALEEAFLKVRALFPWHFDHDASVASTR